MADTVLAKIVITKMLTQDGVYVFVDGTCAEDDDLPLIEALGMVELAKDSLLRSADGE
jgi:hypothetical protein